MTVIVENPSELSCRQQQVNKRDQERRGDGKRQDDLEQRDHGAPSEALGPQQRVGQVEQQAERDEAGERIVEGHGSAPLQAFAGIGVTDACDEEAEDERQHDYIEHGMFLCDMNREPT
jgi:hypothetical protein